MDSKKLAKLHSIYGIILAVLVLVSGVCLAASALHIFLTGDAPHYSREIVGQHLLYIAAPLSLMVLATIGGVVLDWVHPLCNTERLRGFQNARVRVRRMSARMNISLLPCEVSQSLAKEKNKRRVMVAVMTVFACLLAVPVILWLCDLSHFQFPYQNADVVTFLFIAIPLAVTGLVALYVTTRLLEASYTRELELLKGQAKVPHIFEKEEEGECPLPAHKRFHLGTGIRVAILTIGVAFVVLGIFNGSMKDVFDKAVKICMECIGLG